MYILIHKHIYIHIPPLTNIGSEAVTNSIIKMGRCGGTRAAHHHLAGAGGSTGVGEEGRCSAAARASDTTMMGTPKWRCSAYQSAAASRELPRAAEGRRAQEAASQGKEQFKQ